MTNYIQVKEPVTLETGGRDWATPDEARKQLVGQVNLIFKTEDIVPVGKL